MKHFHMCMCKYTRMSKMNVKKEKAVTYDLMIEQRISIFTYLFDIFKFC